MSVKQVTTDDLIEAYSVGLKAIGAVPQLVLPGSVKQSKPSSEFVDAITSAFSKQHPDYQIALCLRAWILLDCTIYPKNWKPIKQHLTPDKDGAVFPTHALQNAIAAFRVPDDIERAAKRLESWLANPGPHDVRWVPTAGFELMEAAAQSASRAMETLTEEQRDSGVAPLVIERAIEAAFTSASDARSVRAIVYRHGALLALVADMIVDGAHPELHKYIVETGGMTSPDDALFYAAGFCRLLQHAPGFDPQHMAELAASYQPPTPAVLH